MNRTQSGQSSAKSVRRLRNRIDLEMTTLLTIGVALLLVPYQQYVQEPWEVLLAPYQRIFHTDLAPTYPLSSIYRDSVPLGRSVTEPPPGAGAPAGKDEPEVDVLYLFLLDVSASTKDAAKETTWLEPAIERIQGYTNSEVFSDFLEPGEKTTFSLAKVRLADLLAGIGPRNQQGQTGAREAFAVYAMGTTTELEYPQQDKRPFFAPLDKGEVEHAVDKIAGLKNAEPHTDFVLAMKTLKDKYSPWFSWESTAGSNKIVVLTILSDLTHDVVDKPQYRQRVAKIEEEWRELERELRRQSRLNVVANLIVVTRTGFPEELRLPGHRQVSQPYEDHFMPVATSRFTIESINAEVQSQLLYPPMRVREPISFLYEGSSFVRTITLEIDGANGTRSAEAADIVIAIPEEVEHRQQPPVSFRWELLTDARSGSDQRDVYERGWVTSDGEIFSEKGIKVNTKLNFIPDGTPAELGGKRVVAKFVSSADRRVYHVDIDFKRIMPLWYAWLVFLLQLALVAVVGLWTRRVFQLAARGLRRVDRDSDSVPAPSSGGEQGRAAIAGIWSSAEDTLILERDGRFRRAPRDESSVGERGRYRVTTAAEEEVVDFFCHREGDVISSAHRQVWRIEGWDQATLDLSCESTRRHYVKQGEGM